MHVLVFEPARSGHHLTFLRYVVEDLLAGGHRVSLATEWSDTPSSALTDELGATLQRCEWVRLSNGAARWVRGLKLDALARAQQQAKADRVFVNCLDLITSGVFRRRAAGLRPPSVLQDRLHGIFMRPRVVDARLPVAAGDAWKQRGFLGVHRDSWLRQAFVLDETLPNSLIRGIDPRAFVPLPDPWDGDFSVSQAEARQRLGLPAKGFLFLQYGTARRRKGLATILRATAALPDEVDAALVCAGRAGSEDADGLARLAARGRAHVFNRYIPMDEEPLFFRACDAVMLAYEGHYGSSNIQSRAAAAGRMVLSSDEGLVGHRTRVHSIGLTFPTGNSEALGQAIVNAAGRDRASFGPALAAYAGLHSRERFRECLLSAFESPLTGGSVAGA